MSVQWRIIRRDKRRLARLARQGDTVDYVKLPKLEAARALGVAPRTIDRMIARGDLAVEREPDGRRRTLVIVSAGDIEEPAALEESDAPEVAALRERVRSFEELADFHREQLQLSESRYQDLAQRNQELVQMLKSSHDLNERLTLALPLPGARRGWKFWRR